MKFLSSLSVSDRPGDVVVTDDQETDVGTVAYVFHIRLEKTISSLVGIE